MSKQRLAAVSTFLALLGLLAAMVGMRASHAREQARVRAKIDEVHGEYFYDYQRERNGLGLDFSGTSDVPTWIRDLLGTDFFHSVTYVNLDSPKVSDATLAEVGKLKQLEQLHISNTSLSSAGLAHLSGLTGLRYVTIVNSGIGGDYGRELSGFVRRLSRLEKLQLKAEPRLSGEFLSPLANGIHLKMLDIADTMVTASEAEVFEQKRPDVEFYW